MVEHQLCQATERVVYKEMLACYDPVAVPLSLCEYFFAQSLENKSINAGASVCRRVSAPEVLVMEICNRIAEQI